MVSQIVQSMMLKMLQRAAGTAAAARSECLLRYREKKLRRLDSNTIRYMKRKINADKRPRCAQGSTVAQTARMSPWSGWTILDSIASSAAPKICGLCQTWRSNIDSAALCSRITQSATPDLLL